MCRLPHRAHVVISHELRRPFSSTIHRVGFELRLPPPSPSPNGRNRIGEKTRFTADNAPRHAVSSRRGCRCSQNVLQIFDVTIQYIQYISFRWNRYFTMCDRVSIRRVSIDRGFRSGQMDFHRHSRTPTLLPRKFLPSPPPRRIHSYAETTLKASRWRVHFSAIGVDGMPVTDGLARVDTHFSIKSPADELYRLIKQAKVTSSSQN